MIYLLYRYVVLYFIVFIVLYIKCKIFKERGTKCELSLLTCLMLLCWLLLSKIVKLASVGENVVIVV